MLWHARKIMDTLTVHWGGPHQFTKNKKSCSQLNVGKVQEYRKELLHNQWQKADNDYETCQQFICASMYGQSHQGDYCKLCIQTCVKHSLCFNKDCVCERPYNFWSRSIRWQILEIVLSATWKINDPFAEKEAKLAFCNCKRFRMLNRIG